MAHASDGGNVLPFAAKSFSSGTTHEVPGQPLLAETTTLPPSPTPHAIKAAALSAAGLLDGPAEPAFDDITRLVAGALGAPSSLITVVDATRQFFVSRYGQAEFLSTARERPLSTSYCCHVIESERPLIVPDAETNPIVSHIGAWRDGFVAYLGVPVRDRSGIVVASLCAADTKPRAWTHQELTTLEGIARLLVRELENRAVQRDLEASRAAARESADKATHEIAVRTQAQEALRARNAQLDLLARTSERLLLMRNGGERALLAEVFAEISGLIGVESYFHYRPSDDDTRLLALALAHGVSEADRCLFATMRFGELLCGRVAETQRRLIVEDLQNCSVPGSEVLHRAGATSYAGFPLVADGRLIGTVAFVSHQRTHFRDGEMRMIQSICDQVAITLERARLQRTLEASEARLRRREAELSRAHRIARLGDFDVTLKDGQFINRRSPGYLAIHGLPQESWNEPHEAWVQRMHPDDQGASEAAFKKAMAEGATHYEAEYRIIRPNDGETRWIRVLAEIDRDPSGKIATLVGTHLDITDRKLAEERIRESEARARDQLAEIETIYASAQVGLCVLDRDLRFRRVNDRLAEMNGVPAADHIGKTVNEIVPAIAGATEKIAAHIFATGEGVVDFELVGETPSAPGVKRTWVEQWMPLRDGAGNITGINIAVEEITARKRAEQALKESEQRFRTIVETAYGGIWAIDRDRRTTLVNPRMAELLGTTVDRMIGLPTDAWVFPEDIEDARERIDAAFDGGREEYEARLRRSDGSALHVLVASAPLRTHDGTIVGAIGGFFDLGERKKAEDRQRMLMREVAHRGKNLLAVVQSIAGRTLDGTRPADQARDAFIGRLQALSRTYASLTDEVFEGAPLDQIVSGELASFGARVHVTGPRVMLTAKVSQTMALVLHELATNAAKYGALSAPDGKLEIRWCATGEGSNRRFHFDWREVGGPPATTPTRRGFGSTLLSTVIGGELRCKPDIAYGEEGFRYRLDAPLVLVGTIIDESPVRDRLKSDTMRAFYDTWASLKGPDGALPLYKSFDRTRFQATGGLTIATVSDADEVAFLEVGRALAAGLGRLDGDSSLVDDALDSIKDAYRRCARSASPCHEHLRFDFGDGDILVFERLLVPFSRGGRRPTHIAGLVVFSGNTQANEERRP